MRSDGRMTSGMEQVGGLGRGRVEPLVDLDGAEAVDLDRLERGLALVAERVGEGRYRVSGGAGDHWVDLVTSAHPRCDCGDHVWRDQVCKHILAALLREGNEHVVRALGTVVARARQAAPVRRAA
ncbi:hypothetical protein tb265_19860 [Gemmatimonadetes bacterium T265]|nr:hypothetical protein tb265_19860 [Gemmatimonadetes bacterium T265]